MSDVGRIFGGRWRIERPLAAGGMGAVFVAVDLHASITREVALKIIKDTRARDVHLVGRFKREAAALAAVRHENVVAFLGSGVDDGALYLVMELLDGHSLRALSRSAPARRVEWTRAFQLVADVCAGLGALHDAGIIHRDLKPENVLVTSSSGRAVLIDLGIVRLEENADTALLDVTGMMTQTGVVLGTPGFISPEQLRGQRATPASDVYAAGVMLFELITGRLPYDGANLELLLRAQVLERALSVRTFAPWVPEHVDTLLARMLAREPSERIATAHEARALLASAVDAQASTETALGRAPGLVPGGAGAPGLVPGDADTSTLSTREIENALRQSATALVTAKTTLDDESSTARGGHGGPPHPSPAPPQPSRAPSQPSPAPPPSRGSQPTSPPRSAIVGAAFMVAIIVAFVVVAVVVVLTKPASEQAADAAVVVEPATIDAGARDDVARDTGTVVVETTQPTDVFVDNVPKGHASSSTPLEMELAPGAHVMKLVVGAGPNREGIVRARNVDVVAGSTVRVVEEMPDPAAARRAIIGRLNSLAKRKANELTPCVRLTPDTVALSVRAVPSGALEITTSHPNANCIRAQTIRWRIDPFEGEPVTTTIDVVVDAK